MEQVMDFLLDSPSGNSLGLPFGSTANAPLGRSSGQHPSHSLGFSWRPLTRSPQIPLDFQSAAEDDRIVFTGSLAAALSDGKFVDHQSQGDRLTHVIFESRGREEDRELELQFRRICDGQNYPAQRLPFDIVIADKRTNAPGLQMADLIARPIGRHILNPSQSNRAWAGIEPKFYCPTGATSPLGCGLKIFP